MADKFSRRIIFKKNSFFVMRDVNNRFGHLVVSVVTKLCQQRDTRTVAESTRLDPECRFIDRPWHSWHSPAGLSSTLLWWDYLDGGENISADCLNFAGSRKFPYKEHM